jgi:hypothetical protein
MSAFQDLETMANMVGFKFASVSVDTETKQVTLQCEDYDGGTITVDSQSIDSAMEKMIDRLHHLAGNQGGE